LFIYIQRFMMFRDNTCFFYKKAVIQDSNYPVKVCKTTLFNELVVMPMKSIVFLLF